MSFVSPTGYVDLDDDCVYSIDRKSTRSREAVDPKSDLAFYFDTYIIPKYGLNNINVNNVASFMKDLEMNWTKIDPEMKPKVLDIMVDGILNKDTSFKVDLLNKLGIQPQQINPQKSTISTFGEMISSSADIQKMDTNMKNIGLFVIALGFLFFILGKIKSPVAGYNKFI